MVHKMRARGWKILFVSASGGGFLLRRLSTRVVLDAAERVQNEAQGGLLPALSPRTGVGATPARGTRCRGEAPAVVLPQCWRCSARPMTTCSS